MLSKMPLKHYSRPKSKIRFGSFRLEHPEPPLEVVHFRRSNLPFHFDILVHFPTSLLSLSLLYLCREFGKGIEYD